LGFLPDLISVAFVGIGKVCARRNPDGGVYRFLITQFDMYQVSPPHLRGLFGVSRARVQTALHWLQLNNPEYHDIIIDESRLSALPDGDVPMEIVVRDEVDPETAAYARTEGAGYSSAVDSGEWNEDDAILHDVNYQELQDGPVVEVYDGRETPRGLSPNLESYPEIASDQMEYAMESGK
jgi:hypothetical protein